MPLNRSPNVFATSLTTSLSAVRCAHPHRQYRCRLRDSRTAHTVDLSCAEPTAALAATTLVGDSVAIFTRMSYHGELRNDIELHLDVVSN